MTFKFNKDSKLVSDMLLLMRTKNFGIDDIDSFIPNLYNLREVVRECLV